MNNYNPIYRKFIDDKNVITVKQMTRGKFYLIKEYEYVDGMNRKFTERDAPIVFTLFVSQSKDVIHCVKVSNVNPIIIKRFFGKFVNEKTELLEIKGNARNTYSKIVSKVPVVTNDAYRTYKMSGIKKVIELNMDVDELTPKNMTVTGIDKKSQIKNR
jgi:hypothetical protein